MAGFPSKTGRAGSASALLITFASAVVLNLAEVLWDPDGQFWLAVRIAVSVAFGATLARFALLRLRNPDSRSRSGESGQA